MDFDLTDEQQAALVEAFDEQLEVAAHAVKPDQQRREQFRGERIHCADTPVPGLVRGREHELADGLPIVPVDRLHVVIERERVHRDFGMSMPPHQLLAFDADGAITQGRSFGGASDDTDVLGHGPIVASRATRRPVLHS